jgi:hypothetical protein
MLNPQFILIAVSILPELIGAIAETVQAVQVNFSDAPPEQKKKEALEAAVKWYRAADNQFKFSDDIDRVVETEFLPGLIELIYKGMKHTPEEDLGELKELAHG